MSHFRPLIRSIFVCPIRMYRISIAALNWTVKYFSAAFFWYRKYFYGHSRRYFFGIFCAFKNQLFDELKDALFFKVNGRCCEKYLELGVSNLTLYHTYKCFRYLSKNACDTMNFYRHRILARRKFQVFEVHFWNFSNQNLAPVVFLFRNPYFNFFQEYRSV